MSDFRETSAEIIPCLARLLLKYVPSDISFAGVSPHDLKTGQLHLLMHMAKR